jgi:hypothetical protein
LIRPQQKLGVRRKHREGRHAERHQHERIPGEPALRRVIVLRSRVDYAWPRSFCKRGSVWSSASGFRSAARRRDPVIRALIANDEELSRRALHQMLRRHADVEVVAECRDGVEARESTLARSSRPNRSSVGPQNLGPVADPFDAGIRTKPFVRTRPSIVFLDWNWRVLHPALVFAPSSQAGRRGFESHRPLFGSLEIPTSSSRRNPNGSRRFFLGTRWGVDFRRQQGLLLG